MGAIDFANSWMILGYPPWLPVGFLIKAFAPRNDAARSFLLSSEWTWKRQLKVVSWKLHEEFQLPLELGGCCWWIWGICWLSLTMVDSCWCLLTFSKDSQSPCSEMHRGQCGNWGASPTCTLTASVGSSGDDSVVVNPEPGAVWV